MSDEITISLDDIPSASTNVMSELDALLMDPNKNYNSGSSSSSGSYANREVDFKIDIEELPSSTSSTWDGYVNQSQTPIPETPAPKMSADEIYRKKLFYLAQFKKLQKDKKIELTKDYNMDSPLSEMKAEYETCLETYEKQNSILFQYSMIKNLIWGLEYMNGAYDPFGIDLEGWSESVENNPEEYEDVLGELFEKYKSKGKMAPELRLAYTLAVSGVVVAATNYKMKELNQMSNGPAGLDAIFNQNPGFLNSFTQNVFPNTQPPPPPAHQSFVPVQQQQQRYTPFVLQSGTRSTVLPPPIETRLPPKSAAREEPPERSSIFAGPPETRPEMSGPSSQLEHILSGMKTTEISISEAPFLTIFPPQNPPPTNPPPPQNPPPPTNQRHFQLDEISLPSQISQNTSQKKKGRPKKNSLSQASQSNMMALDL